MTWFNARPYLLDPVTNAMTIILSEHQEIHEGDHYFVEGFMILDAGDSFFEKIQTPDSEQKAHFVWEIESSAILETNFYEEPTGGMTGGSNVDPVNNNRNSSNTSVLIITSGVTACTGGTKISSKKWGSRSSGGGQTRADEIILKQNAVYCREFISSTNSNIVNFKANWYEHKDRG